MLVSERTSKDASTRKGYSLKILNARYPKGKGKNQNLCVAGGCRGSLHPGLMASQARHESVAP
jgi:hypothetical protein